MPCNDCTSRGFVVHYCSIWILLITLLLISPPAAIFILNRHYHLKYDPNPADSQDAWMTLPGGDSGISWSTIDKSLRCRERLALELREMTLPRAHHPCVQSNRPKSVVQPTLLHRPATGITRRHTAGEGAVAHDGGVYVALVQQIVPSSEWDAYSDPRQAAMIGHVISLNKKYW